jgi:hypothetical protein
MNDVEHNTEMNPKCSLVIRAYNEEEPIGRQMSGILQRSHRF